VATPLGNLVSAAAAAGVVALLLAVPSIGGVSTWKYVLAAIGLALFVLAGRGKPKKQTK
jgi:hypothetical protein